jgi:argininosuccinate lyase
MATFMLQNITVNKNILDDPKYAYLFSVEEVNKAVLNGTPFRDAYKQVGLAIEQGDFNPDKNISHTHEGSIGNLQNEQITAAMDKVISSFDFKTVEAAIEKLVRE